MKPVLFLVFILFTSTACHGLAKTRPSVDASNPATNNSSIIISTKKGLPAACTQSGGEYDAEQFLCHCPNGMSFSGWIEACLPIQYDSNTEEISFTGYPSVPSYVWTSQGDDTGFHLSAIHPTWNSSYQIGSLASSFNFSIWVGSTQPDARITRALRSMLSEGGYFILPRPGYRPLDMVYSTYNRSNPISIFQTPRTSELKSLPTLPNELESLLGNDVFALSKVTGVKFHPQRQVDRVSGGCEKYCELNEDFYFPELSVELTRTRVIAGGSLLKDWIKIWENSTHTSVRTLAVFTPSGEFSHLYRFSMPKSEETSSMSIYRLMSVFDSRFHAWISDQPISQPFSFEALSALRNNWSISRADSKEPQVVVCESGFDEKLFMKFPSNHILHGPHSSTLFGWVDTPNHSSPNAGALYYSGSISRNEFGVPQTIGDLSTHAESVVYSLANSEDQLPSIIPIGIEECMRSTDLWSSTVLEHSKARVITLSSTDNFDTESCANSPILKSIEFTHQKFLWVVAAGNDGLNLDDSFNDACPANLKRDDLIVVAAGDSMNWTRDTFSNFGNQTVDLLTDGRSPRSQNQRATSFAAPKVAAVAAEIVAKFPNLTPPQIKKILILSAEVEPESPLPVRSGGFLSRDRALRLADFRSNHPQVQTAEALQAVFGNSSSTHHLIRFFHQRGLLN